LDDLFGGRDRRRVIVLLGAILGLQAADTASVGALAAPIERAFDVGNTSIGLLVTVTTLVGCVATLPFGVVSDRHSRTRLLQVVIALWAVATLVASLSISWPMLLLTRVALGGVIGAAGPALASLFGDLVPGDERSRLWSYVLTGELIGAGIGILVAGVVSDLAGWRVAMGVLALPAVVLVWALYHYLPEPARGGQAHVRTGEPAVPSATTEREAELAPPSEVEIQAEEAGVEPEPELVLRGADLSLWQAARYVLRIRTNVALIIASGLGYFFLAGLETFAELYFRDRFGVGQSGASSLFLLIAVGALIGVIVSGTLTDALICRGVTAARVMVGAVAYVAVTLFFVPGIFSRSLLLAMPILFAAAAFVGAANPPVDAARLDIVPPPLWGRAEAIRTALRQSLQGAAPLLFGLVSEAFGGARAGLSTGVNTTATAASAASAHGLEMAFVILSTPLLLGGAALWLCRSVYLREIVAARRSDENLVAGGG
jgi:predicted MFS family arabinose efflux permease